jgi:hypothetical protein
MSEGKNRASINHILERDSGGGFSRMGEMVIDDTINFSPEYLDWIEVRFALGDTIRCETLDEWKERTTTNPKIHNDKRRIMQT